MPTSSENRIPSYRLPVTMESNDLTHQIDLATTLDAAATSYPVKSLQGIRSSHIIAEEKLWNGCSPYVFTGFTRGLTNREPASPPLSQCQLPAIQPQPGWNLSF